MLNTLVWAILTAAITAGVWVAIVLAQRQRRLSGEQHDLSMDMYRRLDALADVDTRMAELEERLNAAERLLVQQRDEAHLPPPPASRARSPNL